MVWGGVPVTDPVANVLLQGVDQATGAAAQFLVGQQAEPPFDLVEPGGVGRGEVHVEAGMGPKPCGDRRRLGRRPVTWTSDMVVCYTAPTLVAVCLWQFESEGFLSGQEID